LDSEHNKIKVRLGEEQRIINKHLLVEVSKIYQTRKTKTDQVEMLDAIVALANIANRVPDTYNTNEGWVVKKMEL
jgi:hypothetical protein